MLKISLLYNFLKNFKKSILVYYKKYLILYFNGLETCIRVDFFVIAIYTLKLHKKYKFILLRLNLLYLTHDLHALTKLLYENKN